MFNITLISTRHDNIGRCNSSELFKEFEIINPDLIFEEMPPSYFEKFYVDKSQSNLESQAIDVYCQKYGINHIPVDSEEIPDDSFFIDYEKMILKIEKLSDRNGFNFRNAMDSHKINTSKYGFKYLNSNYCTKLNDDINEAIINGLQKLNDEMLIKTYKKWNQINDMRENHMLKSIYKYSETNKYERAIFTIGSAHRNSVIDKIAKFEKQEKIKLNWIIINNAST